MKLILIGDIHSRWAKVNGIVKHEGCLALSSGDLGNYDYDGESPLYFTPGNHENPRAIKDLLSKRGKLRPIQAGEKYFLPDGTTLAGLPGVYSDFMFNNPHANGKYFKREDIEHLKSLRGIDILLTHEAPSQINLLKDGRDVGKECVRELILALRPRVVFSGHNHTYHEGRLDGIPSYGLDQPNHSYLVLDTQNFSVAKINASMTNKQIGYQYGWEKS